MSEVALDYIAKILAIFGGAIGAIFGLAKMVKYLADSRKKMENKIDAIKETLEAQHLTDISEIKNGLADINSNIVKFDASLEITNSKLEDLANRVTRTENKLDTTYNDISEMKTEVSNIASTQKTNSHRLEDLENKDIHKKQRIVYKEDKHNKSSVRKKSSRGKK